MIVDVDFRPQAATVDTIAPHLSRAWREHLRLGELSGGAAAAPWGLPSSCYSRPPESAAEGETYWRTTFNAGAAAGMTRDEAGEEARRAARSALAEQEIACAILDPGTAPELSGITNPGLAAEVARATNDWLAEEWLDVDDRLLGSLLVGALDPKAAAAEIRRWAGEPRFVQVVLAYPPTLLGNRFLHPVFEAAAEQSLVVCLECGGAYTGGNGGLTAVGFPSTLFEYESSSVYAAQPQLLSLIGEGIFDRFPEIRVVFRGFGFVWALSLLWRMDAVVEAGHMPRAPSEYVHDFVGFTTAGLEVPRDAVQLANALSLVEGERLLVYGSGPEPAGDGLAALPDDWRHPVGVANAERLYRLDLPEEAKHGAGAAGTNAGAVRQAGHS